MCCSVISLLHKSFVGFFPISYLRVFVTLLNLICNISNILSMFSCDLVIVRMFRQIFQLASSLALFVI